MRRHVSGRPGFSRRGFPCRTYIPKRASSTSARVGGRPHNSHERDHSGIQSAGPRGLPDATASVAWGRILAGRSSFVIHRQALSSGYFRENLNIERPALVRVTSHRHLHLGLLRTPEETQSQSKSYHYITKLTESHRVQGTPQLPGWSCRFSVP